MISKLIKLSIENKLIVVIIGTLLFVYGLFVTKNIPLEVLPEFAPPQIIIQTHAPGFAAEEVEAQVTIPLESSLNGTQGVQVVRSSSIEGLSFITVIFNWNTNVYNARQLVLERVQAVTNTFSESIKQPVLSPITSPIGNVLIFALTSKVTSLMDLRTYADWEIKNKLLSIPGITKVLVYGGDIKQYQVLVNPNKLKQYNISLNEVVNAVEDSNLIIGGGYLVEKDKEFLIRGLGRISSIEELKNSVIKERNNVPIHLKDIANVKIGTAFKRSSGSVNGKEAVIVSVSKSPFVNTLKLNEKIQSALKDLKKALPKDIKITETFNQSNFINISITNIASAILQGSLLVIVVLFLFLGNWRTILISLVVIPLSLIAAIIVLKYMGLTINAMTLGGLAVSIGVVVDDAIIDIENVYKRLKENKQSKNPKSFFEVIFSASYEIRKPIIYGTLIIMSVLIPVLFLQDLAGTIFKPLAWAYIIAIFASLVMALTLTPACAAYLLSKNEDIKEEEPKVVNLVKEKYLSILDNVLQKPKPFITTAIVITLIAIATYFYLGKAFIPELGEENLIIMSYSPPGSSLKVTQKVALLMEKKLKKFSEILTIGNRAGRSEGDDEPITVNLSHFDIMLKSNLSLKKKEKLIHEIRKQFEEIPGVYILVRSFISEVMDNVISGQRAPIVLKLYGNDLEVLREKAQEIVNNLRTIKTFSEVQLEQIANIPQVHIKIKREIAARYGLKAGDLVRMIHYAYSGKAASQKVIEGQRSFDLLIWFDSAFRNNLEIIKNTFIDTPAGIKIPLSQLATIKESLGPNIINREKASRRIVILLSANKRHLSQASEKAKKIIEEKIKLPTGYRLEFEGEYMLQQEASQVLFLIGFLVLLSIYFLLSIAVKSFKVGTIIMINLPLALVGGIFGILLTSKVISIGSIIGFITLFGISTRNCILLVNRFIDIKNENPGLYIDEVIKQGAQDRIRPILMTALTTAFAMLPLALFPGAGTEIEHPLAIVILGGMISATALTLFVIPVVYKKLAN